MTRDLAIDAAGVTHPIASGPVRIASLVPSITELLFALGLGTQVLARTTYCVHPSPAVDRVKTVGGTKRPRLDTLRALEPTHAVVNIDENRKEDVDEMRAFVPNVIVTHPLEPTDNLDLFRLLGTIFDRVSCAEHLCARFTSAYEALTRSAKPNRRQDVLYLIWRKPWMTVSRSTYISRMLALIAWNTVGHDANMRYPSVEIDEVMLARVDRVLLSSEPFPFKQRHVAEIRALAHPDRIPRVSLIDGEMTSWYGVRAIAGLNYLAMLAQDDTA